MLGARQFQQQADIPAPFEVEPVTLIDDVSDADWHSAMCLFSDIHYEQTALYSAGLRGEQSSHLLHFDGSKPAFGARVGIYSVPFIQRGIALLRFGPFWRHAGETPDATRYKAAIRALIDEYCVRRKLYLVVRPRAHPDYYPAESQILEELGLRQSSTTMLDRYFVDARLSENEQNSSLEKRWRYNLKIGRSHGLEVRFGESAAEMAIFQRIYAEMVARKNLNYPGVDLVDLVPQLTAFPQEMRLRIALAYYQDRPIAGAAFSVNGDIAYYVFGASSDIAVELQAGHILQWHILSWLREHSDVQWYELGGPGDPGIRQFKKGLAGKRGVLLPVKEFHYSTDPLAKFTALALFKARDARNTVQRLRRRTR